MGPLWIKHVSACPVDGQLDGQSKADQNHGILVMFFTFLNSYFSSVVGEGTAISLVCNNV